MKFFKDLRIKFRHHLELYISILYVWLMMFLFFWIATIFDVENKIANYKEVSHKRFVVYEENGKDIINGSQLPFKYIPIEDISPLMIEAILATEDKNFFYHHGINPISIIRASIINIKNQKINQGGSTISQQLAKNLFLSSEKTIKRKMQEISLTMWLESKYDKNALLELYLNIVYFGAGAYGINDAAHIYFSKDAKDLNLSQSALLVGLLKAPSNYSPFNNLNASIERAKKVINDMYKDQIDKEINYDEIFANLGLNHSSNLGSYAYDMYRYNFAENSNIIHATINNEYQKIIENKIADNKKYLEESDLQISVILLNKEGELKGITGGLDYNNSIFNRAIAAKRQPGSVFKIFVYLTAIKNGYRPLHILEDKPIDINGFAPKNYKNKYYGKVTFEEAFAKSLNSVSLYLTNQLGEDNVLQTANNHNLYVGEKSPGLALSLGVIETTNYDLSKALLSIASRGDKNDIVISYKKNNDLTDKKIGTINNLITEKNIDEENQTKANQLLLTEEEWNVLYRLMNSVTTYGTGKNAAIENFNVYGKTGTTQSYRDSWFAGFVDEFICIIWIGKDKGMNDIKITGGTLPATLFSSILSEILEIKYKGDYSNIEQISYNLSPIKNLEEEQVEYDPIAMEIVKEKLN